MVRLTVLLAFVAAACGGGDDDDTTLRARYVIPADDAVPIAVADVPYPNDALRGPDGNLLITADSLPFSAQADALAIPNLAEHLASADCFGVTSGVIFPLDNATIEDPIDLAAAPAGAVEIIDLETGERLPIETHYRIAEGQIFARPRRGIVLRQGAQYAAVLHRSITTTSGVPLESNTAVTDALDGKGPARLVTALAPLAGEMDASDVVSATVFTTCDIDADMEAVQRQLQQLPFPTATINRIIAAGPDLDDLCGVPDDNRFPGADNPGGIAHADIGYVVIGTFNGPNYQSAVPSQLGSWEHGANGEPVVKADDDVPFLLVLPAGVDSLADLPVVVFQHGLNSSKVQVMHVANTLAARGFAVIGIDIPFHGARHPEAHDSRHNFTGTSGPDGLADDTGATAAAVFFDLIGDAENEWLEPSIITASFRQSAVDMMSLSRLIVGGDWSALTATAGLEELSFDGDKLLFASESFGSIIGAVAVGFDDDYGAAYFGVGGGNLFAELLENSPTYGGLFLPILGGAYDIAPNEIDPLIDPAHTHIAFQLLGPSVDAADPIAYAHRLLAQGKHIALASAFSDESVPNQSGEALAYAIGLPWVEVGGSSDGPRYVPELTDLSAPAGQTAAFIQIEPATHGMLTRHFGKRKYILDFPPFDIVSPAIEIENPIVELQTQLADYAESYFNTGTPELTDPF